MICNCINEIEKNALAKLTEENRFKRPVVSVTMGGVLLAISDGRATSRTANTLEITLEGQKKKEKISMFHSFCPFCGKKQDEEA